MVQRGSDPGNWACGVGNLSCSAWDTFPLARWLLLAAAFAPFILAWIVIRGHALSWRRGEATAIVGLTAFVLIAFSPSFPPSRRTRALTIGLSFGYWLALLSSRWIFLSGGLRAVESGGGARRKPPATF